MRPLPGRWTPLSRVSRVSGVCGITSVLLVCWIAWIDIALVRRPVRRVDDGVVQSLLTIFLGPTALLFLLAAVIGTRRERTARVIAYCGAVWPVLMVIVCFTAFSFY